MLKTLLDWLDDRTGYRDFLAPILQRVLPDGPKWTRTLGACMLALFAVELVTGLLLMATYSPSETTAWASVHYIEQFAGGAFLRGLHYFVAHALIVVAVLHFLRVLVAGTHRAPQELTWITGVFLLLLIVLFNVSGNPLAATNKGMTQIDTEANIAGSVPVVGPAVRRILLGGDEVGHLALVHFYALHVALLPLAGFVLFAIHFAQVYRHSLKAPIAAKEQDGEEDAAEAALQLTCWPHQTIQSAIVLAIVFGVCAFLSWKFGAPLEAPADPDLASASRPEWYFLFLFEMRKLLGRNLEFLATVVIPTAVFALLFLMPWIDRILPRGVAVGFRCIVALALLIVCGGLTAYSLNRDWRDPEFIAAAEKDEQLSRRALELAGQNEIPPQGAAALLRGDPKTQGPVLFERHCASCHPHVDKKGEGIPAEEPSAPNLHGFGRLDWHLGWLDRERIAGVEYLGGTKFADPDDEGEMFSYVVNDDYDVFLWDDEDEQPEVQAKLKKIARALVVEARLPGHEEADKRDAAIIAEGRSLIENEEEFACIDCHEYYTDEHLTGPDLTGYGSREWLTGIIAKPEAEPFYSDDTNDRMPAYAADPEHPENNVLSERELGLLVDWLRGDWYEPAAGEPTEKGSSD